MLCLMFSNRNEKGIPSGAGEGSTLSYTDNRRILQSRRRRILLGKELSTRGILFEYTVMVSALVMTSVTAINAK